MFVEVLQLFHFHFVAISHLSGYMFQLFQFLSNICNTLISPLFCTYIEPHHSAAGHKASTRILHLALFLALILISAQVLLPPLASSSTVLRHVFLGLPLPRLPWGFHCRTCLAMRSGGFRSVWPSHPLFSIIPKIL